jgi:hypothetical protein
MDGWLGTLALNVFSLQLALDGKIDWVRKGSAKYSEWVSGPSGNKNQSYSPLCSCFVPGDLNVRPS